MHVVLIGDLEVARAACALLTDRGTEVTHLIQPTDTELRSRLDESVDAVAVLIRGDVAALRYSLLVEHLRPGVRLVATLFDRTLSEQLLRVVPNCEITSPADIAVPSIVAACLDDGTLAVDVAAAEPTRLVPAGDSVEAVPYRPPRRGPWSRASTALNQLRPHDDTTRILLSGAGGMLLILLLDWILTMAVLHRGVSSSLYAATRVVTTVGPGDADPHTGSWYLITASIFMLITIVLTAILTAGVVNRLLSPRSISIIGRRVMPRHDHVVIVGLGQVGLRLATALRRLHIPVVVVERDPAAANLRLARTAGVPVLIGRGEDRAVLRQLRVGRARAVAAMGAVDLDNVEIAIAALAVAPDVAIVLRAGDDDVITETRSLFRIGEVRDVSALTAAAVIHSVAGTTPRSVYTDGHRIMVYDGQSAYSVSPGGRCSCTDR